MALSPKEYDRMTKKTAPNSKLGHNMLVAFFVGGLICTIGQGVLSWLLYLDLPADDAKTISSMCLIFLSALLTGLNCYDNIAKHAGAGTLVPITGFANAMVSPALEFRREGLILGVGGKMFTIAGPVLVYGTAASVLYGVILAIIR